MSSGQKPRTRKYYPKMKDRSLGRRTRRMLRQMASAKSPFEALLEALGLFADEAGLAVESVNLLWVAADAPSDDISTAPQSLPVKYFSTIALAEFAVRDYPDPDVDREVFEFVVGTSDLTYGEACKLHRFVKAELIEQQSWLAELGAPLPARWGEWAADIVQEYGLTTALFRTLAAEGV